MEVAARGIVLVRDSKNPQGLMLEVSPQKWREFIEQIKNSTEA